MRQPKATEQLEADGVRALSVGDFMTRELVTLTESDDLALAEQMLRLSGIRHLPVVREQKLVGILTHRDLLRSAASRPARSTLAGEVMTRDPVAVMPATSLVQAARALLHHKFGCLPVCDAEGTLLGIITESDFVRFAADMVQDLDLVAEAVRGQHRA
ncbi:MAG TPA: CBS domain-containing protein [Anaeromyxobacteraceae bacterium]|nr:CBS domain-containing protein [Anaeromyxobacteraceae bacterium]